MMHEQPNKLNLFFLQLFRGAQNICCSLNYSSLFPSKMQFFIFFSDIPPTIESFSVSLYNKIKRKDTEIGKLNLYFLKKYSMCSENKLTVVKQAKWQKRTPKICAQRLYVVDSLCISQYNNGLPKLSVSVDFLVPLVNQPVI